MKNKELFLSIVRRNFRGTANELKDKSLYLATESTSVKELAEILKKKESEIIAFFWKKGQVVEPNKLLPIPLLTDYCQSAKIKVVSKPKVDFRKIIEEYLNAVKGELTQKMVKRPLIVSIMGHVDHGKTTLLDTTVRYFNSHHQDLQSKEVGGITQKITVFPLKFQEQEIIFLDTPGHSDFIRLRQQVISSTDLVVLVIDAKEGIMEQTEDIISYLCNYKLPVIVFINHKRPTETDNESNLNRLRSQLQQRNLTPAERGWEGKTIVVYDNAKRTTAVEKLLEGVSLFMDCRAYLSGPTHGVVIDSYLESRTHAKLIKLLVQGGKLHEKDTVFLNGKFASIRMMYDIYEQRINEVYPGHIAQVSGLGIAAELGDKFLVVNEESQRIAIEKELVDYWAKKRMSSLMASEKKDIKLILVADSQNSLATLADLVQRKSTSDFSFSVISTAVGNLPDSILSLAKIERTIILVFGFQLNQPQIGHLQACNLPFFASKIVYEIEKYLTEITTGQQTKTEIEETIGKARVKKVIIFSKVGAIAGCQVLSGKINRNSSVWVLRGKNTEKIFTGKIKSLESNNKRENEVARGQECGIVLDGFSDFQTDDEIVAFRMTYK